MAQYSEGSIVIECSLETKELFENANKARKELGKLGDSGSDTAKGLDKVDKSAKSTGDSLGKLTTIAKAVSAALVSSKIIAYAESWNELEDRIQNTGATAQETKTILEQLLETSNRNGRKIEETAELYIKLSGAMKELGYSSNNTTTYIGSLSDLMTINQTSAMGAESAINALTKAQIKGKLSGDQAMAVFSNMPSVLGTLVNYYKKNAKSADDAKKYTQQYIQQLANEGKLSIDVFTKALIDNNDELNSQADNMRNKVSDGINRVTNNLKNYLGELNNTTGATQKLVDALILMSEHVDILVGSVGVLTAVYVGKYITSLMASVKVKIEDISASINQAKAENVVTKAKLDDANATMVLIAREKAALITTRQLAIEQLKVAKTAQQRSDAINEIAMIQKRLNTLEKQELASKAALTTATNNYAASQAKLSLAMRTTSAAGNLLRNSLNLLGGPAGILLIAAGAFMTWSANADEAKRKSLELTDSVDTLTEAFKKMTAAQMDSAIYDLDKKIQKQTLSIKSQESAIKSFQKTNNNVIMSTGVVLPEDYQGKLKTLKAELDTMRQVLEQDNKLMSQYVDIQNRAKGSTDNLTGSSKDLNNVLSQTAIDDIASKQAKLNQELEVASLKQNKHNKEAYVYQNVLSVLGKEADKYQSSLIEAAKSGQLFSGHIQNLPPEITNLIAKYGELFDATNKSSESFENNGDIGKKASDEIKTLTEQLEVAKLEAKGLTVEARLLAITQQLNTETTKNQVDEIRELIQAQEDLSQSVEKRKQAEIDEVNWRKSLESKSSEGQQFAEQEVYSNQSKLKQIDIDEQAKLDKLSEWFETEKQLSEFNNIDLLAQERLYQEAKTAIIDNASKKRQQIDEDEQNKRLQLQSQLLSSTGNIFDGLAGITESFAGKQNAAYKALYAVSKGFAIADAILNMQIAISKASTLQPPASYAAMATAAAQGSKLVSTISSLSYGGGREHGGRVSSNSIYRVGENNKPEILMSGGRQYMIPGEAGKVISNKDVMSNSRGGGSTNITVNQSITFESGQDSNQSAQQTAMLLKQAIINVLQEEKRQGGLLN